MDGRQPTRQTWRTRNKLKKAAARIPLDARHGLELLEARQLLAADVIISEIMFHPSSNDVGEEYIELYNRGDTAANLANWQIDRGVTFTFTGGTLGAGEFLVVAADAAKFNAKYPAISNVVGGWTGNLSNAGEEIRIIDNLGATVDQVQYADDGDWGVRERGRGVQLVGSITNSGSTATVNLFDHDFANGDSIEIFGADQAPYNGIFDVGSVTGTTFQYTMSSTPSGPATGLILARRLTDRNHSGWSWVSYADGLGKSLELINTALGNNDGQNWSASSTLQGTPGNANSVNNPDVAPLITEVKQTPIIPRSTDSVLITTELKDENTASASATIFWRRDNTGSSFTPVSMNDSGTGGDVLAGDGIWSGTIPPQASNTVVEYYISSSDGVNTRTYPAPALVDGAFEQSANRLYQVDNSAYTGQQMYFKLIMTEAERAELRNLSGQGGSDRFSNALMNGTFIAQGPDGLEIRHTVGFRNRGGGSRFAPNTPNYHITLQDDETWNGVSALNFNGEYSMEDVIGSAMFRAAGVPAQKAVPVQVRVNNSNLAPAGTDTFGSYAWMQSEDSDMAADLFPLDSEGNYYRNTDDDGQPANLLYIDANPGSYLRAYHLQTNTDNPDYADLLNLTRAFTASQTPDANFVAAINANLHVEEWMRYYAASILLGHQETSLSNGVADDFSLYAGAIDPRFYVIPHDIDTLLGRGDGAARPYNGVFQAVTLTANSRLLRHPTFAPMYAAALKELSETVFAAENINALIDNTLGGYVDEAARAGMKNFVANRITSIFSPTGNPPVPLRLRVIASSLPGAVNGYPQVSANSVSFDGQANAIKTRSVLVNGQPATWTPGPTAGAPSQGQTMANWSASVTGLRPGINRILIQSLDESGIEFERMYQDIWYDDATMTVVGGILPAGTTTWSPANGPYNVTGTITVNAGSTLVIQPGTTVFFNAGTQLIINGGRLDAQGTDLARIRLTRTPGAASNWSGIRFTNTMLDNRMAYLDQAFAATTSESINASASRLSIDHMEWMNTTAQILDLSNSSIRLTNSIIPTVGAVETVHFAGTIPSGGEALLQGNIFGGNSGFNDEIDWTGGQRPGPILQLIDNIFMGPYEDDILDLDGTDAHIEGNVFMNAHLVDPSNPDTSSAVSGGLNGADRSEWTVVRNFFYDLDHANLTKEGAFLTFVNNTVVNIRVAAINFDEPLRTGITPGQGASLDGNIFWNVPLLFENVNSDGTSTQITVNRSIVPVGTPPFPGTALSTMDPSLLNITGVLNPRAELILRPGPGPAVGTGPNGVDMGADIPQGATIGGVPLSPTRSNSATITVGGPDIWAYRYRLDGGAWSPDRQVVKLGATITRSGTTATVTLVNHGYANGNTVRISGVHQNEYNGTFVISGVTANTFNYTITGAPLTPATGNPNAILVQRQEPIILSGLTNGTHTIQVIRKTSAGVWQAEADATSKTWTVNTGLPAPTIRINEVLAQNTAAANHSGTFPDMIELHNAGPTAIDLSGMSLTDNPSSPTKYVFPAGTPLLGAGQYLVVYADNPNPTPGIHLGFALRQAGEGVYLYNTLASGGAQIDGVTFGYQLEDHSISRQADGSWRLSTPTFGAGPNFPGALNTALPLGDPRQLQINEWGTHGLPPFSQDFIEVYNPTNLPVDMGGLSLTDQPFWPNKSVIPALTFVASKKQFHFRADNDPEQGADHLDFSLASERGEIGLFDPAGERIDLIVYGTQQVGLSQGRSPDGGPLYQFFAPPNPGVPNPGPTPVVNISVPLIQDLTQVWKYNDARLDKHTTDWKDLTSSEAASWPSGFGLLYWEPDAINGPKNTPLNLGSTIPQGQMGYPANVTPTFYFRTTFTLSHPVSSVLSLQLRTFLDDGAIVYLNDHEIFRLGMPTNVGSIGFGTYTQTGGGNGRNVGNASLEGPFTITDLSSLVQGTNVLAVEVHQSTSGSSDVVWGATLSAIVQGSVTDPPDLRITEVNYNPPGGGVTYSPNDYEWIELKNTGVTPLDLAGIHFDSGVTFSFTSGTLAPGETGVIVKNQAAFTSRYGTGINILGQYTDSLDDNGEGLRLVDSQGVTIQDFAYSDSWHPATDGDGHTLTIIDPSAHPSTWLSPDSWRPSKFVFGSPATTTENAIAVDSVVVNEISTNGSGADFIELHNPTASPIDISGWYLTNSAENLLKFRIPATTIIQPGEYISFDESQFNTAGPIAFTLSELGGDVYLSSSATPGILAGYHQGFSFGPGENDVTFGRYTTSTGQVDHPPLSGVTRDAANAYPKIGPVVINEVMYNPATADGEFIELRNVSGAAVILDNWKFLDGIEFTFPAGTSLDRDALLLIVDQDPLTFRATYNVPAAVQIFQFIGALSNADENIALGKPGPDAGGFVPYYLVDRVHYGDAAPWPITPDGQGPSLARKIAVNYGNDPINWAASTATGGTPGQSNIAGNNDPLVSAGADATLNLGGVYTSAGSFVDPDAGQTWTATVNYGDGSGIQTLTLNPNKTFSLNHTYTSAGAKTITVTIIDNLGGIGIDTINVTVNPVLNGSAGDDVYYTRLSGGNLQIYAGTSAVGQPLYTVPANSASFTFNGNAGNDRLIVDFVNGAPLASGSIIYAGGAQTTTDTLTVIGGSGANNTGSYLPTAGITGSGTVSVGGHAINYSGLEPILVSNFNTFTLIAPSTNDSLTLDGPVSGQTRISGGTAFESISFTNVTNFIIDTGANDAGAGNDIVNINGGTAATGLFALQIRLGTGTNTVNAFGGTSNLNISTTAPGTVTVNVHSTVNFMASQRLTTLNVNGTATARLAAGANKFLRVNSFTVAATAALDLTDNDMIIQSTSGNKGALYSTIANYLLTGRAGGAWNGRRINSSAAAANPDRITGLAAIINDVGDGVTRIRTDLAGEPVDVNTILIKYTWNGDGDLNGVLNADDYALIDAGYAARLTGYRNGDFDYSGTIDADDYFRIDKAFSSQSGVLTNTAPTEAQPAASAEVLAPESPPTDPAPAPAPTVVADDPAPAAPASAPPVSKASTGDSASAPALVPVVSSPDTRAAQKKTRRHRHHRTRDSVLQEKPDPRAWKSPATLFRR